MKAKKRIPVIGAITGSVCTALGTIGAYGLCCTPLVAAILSICGVSSLFFAKYNVAFLVIGILLILLSAILYLGNKKCKIK
jgi:hypothetical protein